jgi:hypothetical protein
MARNDAPLLTGLLRRLDREDRAFDPEIYRRKAESVLDQLLPMQRQLAEDWHKRLCLLTPGKNGKTFTVRARLLRMALTKRNAYGLYIGLSRQKAKEDIWDGESGLRSLVELLGLRVGQHGEEGVDVVFSNQDLIAWFPKTGSLIRVGGADNMEAIEKYRGGPGYDEVWIDEAKSLAPKLLKELIEEILEPRISWKAGVLGICGTPGAQLDGLFYELTRNQSELSISCTDENPDPLRWSCHRWSLEQNTIRLPGQTSTAWERALELKRSKGWTDRNTTWRREYLGQWCAELTANVYKFQKHDEVTGAPWNIWHPLEKTKTNPFGLYSQVKVGEQWQPIAWHFGIGMDMGENDMFALEVFAWSAQLPSRLYQVHEVVKRFRDMDVAGERPFSRVDFIGMAITKAIEMIRVYDDYPLALVADMAHMGETILVEVLIKYGHKVDKALKNDKEGFQTLVNDDLVDGRMQLFADDEDRKNVLAQQMTELQYDETGKREKPGQPNDACDCTVYVRGAVIKFLVHTAPPLQEQRNAAERHVDQLLQASQPRRDERFTNYNDFTVYDPRGG